MEAKGQNGTVVFDGTFITIRRTGFVAKTSTGGGEKRIPLSSIGAVQYKAPGKLLRGFLEFSVIGEVGNRSRAGLQAYDATTNENAVVIMPLTGKWVAEARNFELLRDESERAIAERVTRR